jgi:hypothetical protein
LNLLKNIKKIAPELSINPAAMPTIFSATSVIDFGAIVIKTFGKRVSSPNAHWQTFPYEKQTVSGEDCRMRDHQTREPRNFPDALTTCEVNACCTT